MYLRGGQFFLSHHFLVVLKHRVDPWYDLFDPQKSGVTTLARVSGLVCLRLLCQEILLAGETNRLVAELTFVRSKVCPVGWKVPGGYLEDHPIYLDVPGRKWMDQW